VNGCECDGSECPSFDSLEQCARQCGRSGRCQIGRMPKMSTSTNWCPVETCAGSYLAVCSSADADPTNRLTSLLPNFDMYCVPNDGAATCDVARFPDGVECRDGDWCCVLRNGTNIGRTRYRQLCRMSLLPSIKPGGCGALE
jgi:hypothetical protein